MSSYNKKFTNELVTEEGLTKEDIKILRASEFYCLDFYKDQQDNYVSCIRCGKDYRDEFGTHTKYKYIPVHAKFSTYADKYKLDDYPKCFESLRHYGYLESLAAIADSVLRAGDILTLHWRVSEGNGYLKNAKTTVSNKEGFYSAKDDNLYQYTVILEIERGNKTLEFYLSFNVCVLNSAAPIKP